MKVYEFSKPKSELFFINYIFKLAGIVLIFAAIYLFATNRGDFFIFIFLFLMGILGVTFNSLLSKFMAANISIDSEAEKINFTMYNDTTHSLKFSEIIDIHIGFYITFKSKNRNLKYNEVSNKKLIPLLEQVRPLKWTIIGCFIHKYW
jgi:hypothetical protein